MKFRAIDTSGPKTFALIFETGDEVTSGLTAFAKSQSLSGGHFTAIGAFQDVVLGYFDWEKREYKRIPVTEQVEVLSLIGDVAIDEGKPKIHAHVVVGKADGTAHGGHLVEAHARPTLELFITESESTIRKSYDPFSTLDLIDLDKAED